MDTKVSRKTVVTVTRFYANNSNMTPIVSAPMTISQAEKRGLTSTDSGTMRYSIKDENGANIYRKNDDFYRQSVREYSL